MRTAINLRTYFQGQIGGHENVVRHTVAGLMAYKGTSEALTIFTHRSQVEPVREFAPRAHIIPLEHESGAQTITSELASGRYDLLFCPLLVLEPLCPPIPSVVWIPDLQHEFFPEFFASDVLAWRRRAYRASAMHASAVITGSEYAKGTIVRKFEICENKVAVVPLGVDEEFRTESREATEAFRSLALPKRYLYYPANFWPHKNHSNLLQAMRILRRTHQDVGLVLTGAPSTGARQVIDTIQELKLQDTVRLLEYQPRPVVAEIYRNASALAFVSKYEGFGIPLLEAFHTETPVIASLSTSCPEVAADAALLVDPDRPREIADAAIRLLDDSELRDRLVRAGRVRREHYSWDRAVRTTLAVVDAAAAQPRIATSTVREYPRVSIVTPSYNKAPFLEQTIQSVLAQDYPHIDYIVMDAVSTDGSVEILRKYDGKLRYVVESDQGQADAVNRGIRLLSGPICTFLNADDTYLQGAVGTAVQHMLRAPGMAVVYGEGYYIDHKGDVIGRYPTHGFDPDLLRRNCYICQPTAFMQRTVFDEMGGLNVDKHCALDYDLWIRISKRYPMLKVDEYLATSRMYPQNKTLRNRRQVYRETIASVRDHYGYVPFDWVFGYASHLTKPETPFFEPAPPTRTQYLMALLMGLHYNRDYPGRYLHEWRTAAGWGPPFVGLWEDGWISKRYATDFRLGPDASAVCIKGRYPEYLRRGLVLNVKLNRRTLGQVRLKSFGNFEARLDVPASERGKSCRLQIQCNQTFNPRTADDSRELGCLIDSIACLEAGDL
jgi:glycosyltransferase involved in cell wall biosynthesis